MTKQQYQIYEITNEKNNRIYIGKTRRSAYKRLDEHIKGHCEDLKKDIEKFGLDQFSIKILRSCENSKDAATLERFHIENASKKGRDLYNIYCTVKQPKEKVAKASASSRKLFGFLLMPLKKKSNHNLCQSDFNSILSKLKLTKDKYIAVELEDYDVLLVRRAN